MEMPNSYQTLPEPLRKYTVGDDRFDPLNPRNKKLINFASSEWFRLHKH